MSGIIRTLQPENPKERDVARGRYAALLLSASLSAKEIEELKRLMIALDETVSDAAEDQRVLLEIKQHRATIRVAREKFPEIEASRERHRLHVAETQSIVDSRKGEQERLSQEHSALMETKARGHDAVDAINALKGDARFAELLAMEPAPSEAELSTPADTTWQK